jgi:4-amino-4-deoxy-L-arabinose transferase-like glycosyltransferase
LTLFPERGYCTRDSLAAVLSTHLPSATGRLLYASLAWLRAHPDAFLLVVLLAGGLLRAAFVFRSTVFIIPDSENYFLPGFQLSRGFGFELEARRAPMYPLFIAAVVSGMGQHLVSLALAQHVLGLATVGLTYWLGRATFGRPAGLIAASLVALNGSLLISEQTVSTETLFTTLIATAALLGVLVLRRGPAWLLAAQGFVLALAALSRPVGLSLLPILPVLLLINRPSWRRWLGMCALYAAGATVVLLPWMVRNLLTLRVFSTESVFGQTLVGRTVRHDSFVFIDPRPASEADLQSGRQRARELMQDAANRGSFITPLRRRLMQELGLAELEANQLMRDLAVEAILRQPDYYLLGTARFFVALAVGQRESLRENWQSRRDPDAREEWESHPEIAALLGPPDPVHERQFTQAEQLATLYQPGRFGQLLLALFAVGVLAAAAGHSSWRPALLPACWAIALLAVGVAFVGPVLRYRYPAEPLLAVLAAGGFVVMTSQAWRLCPRVNTLKSPGRV